MNPNAANRLAIATSVAAVLLLCALATGRNCSSPRYAETMTAADVSPSENQAVNLTVCDAPLPSEIAADATSDDDLNKVRQAARDLVKSALPNLKQDGVFTLTLRHGDLYIAGVDTADGNKKRTIDVLVRRYVRKNGAPYYRAESLTPEQAAKYTEMAE